MLKKLITTAFVALALAPAIATSATNRELEERINELQEELQTTNDILFDLSDESEKWVDIAGYTDVEYITSTKEDTHDSFRMHHFNLQLMKNFGNKWRFFSEIEFEDAPQYEGEGHEQPETIWVDLNNDTIVDPGEVFEVSEGAVVHDAKGGIFVEAVNFTYQHSQELSVRLGRTLTPAGIWNVDHYSSNVPTQLRPQHITHDGSIFPSALDGVQVFGTVPMGASFLNYDVYMGNGRGENPGHGDNNDEKATGTRLSFIFPYLSHFELGVSKYTDAGDGSHDGEAEFVGTGYHGKIKSGPVTLQFEHAMGESDEGAEVHETKGYYAQLLYDWKKYTFGTRHDYYNPHADEKEGVTINSLFVNYHVNTNVTLKVEQHMYNHEDDLVDDFNTTIFSVVGYLGN